MPTSLRLSVCLNAGPSKGQPQATLLVAPNTDAILQAAANKLRLKKKDVARAQLFVWRTGSELPRDASVEGEVENGDLLAIALGEPYAGPTKPRPQEPPVAGSGAAGSGGGGDASYELAGPFGLEGLPQPPQIRGADDTGRQYASLPELHREQAAGHEAFYAANDAWWDDDGYGGGDDEQAMIGDEGSEADVEHSRGLLDRVRAERPGLRLDRALDGGAGVGRVTKHVLLRRCERVTLLEPCGRWLKQARRYLGHKRASRCEFVCERLESHDAAEAALPRPSGGYSLIWLQWCLQYLVDGHVISALRRLAGLLAPQGVIVVKENRPRQRHKSEGARAEAPGAAPEEAAGGTAGAAEPPRSAECEAAECDEFLVDMPEGPNARFDVTRPDAHHRWLWSCAGLSVAHWEAWDEVGAWVLCPSLPSNP